LSPPMLMNPNPLFISRLIVPSAISPTSYRVRTISTVLPETNVGAAPPLGHDCIVGPEHINRRRGDFVSPLSAAEKSRPTLKRQTTCSTASLLFGVSTLP
jgi:hypothetical protein